MRCGMHVQVQAADLCNEALVSLGKLDRGSQVHSELLAPVVQQVCSELLQAPQALVYLYTPVCTC